MSALKEEGYKLKDIVIGFYAINGNNVVCFQERSKKENVIEVLRMIRGDNREKPIVIDNFPSHKADDVRKEAEKLEEAYIRGSHRIG